MHHTTVMRCFVSISIAATCALLSGCAVRSYPSQAKGFYDPYKAGDMATAAQVISKKAAKATSLDKLLWRLEEGSVLLAAGDFDGSLRAFEVAESQLADYESRATVNVRAGAREMASAITNPTAIPYKGTTADKIMLNTYKCLAYLRQGKVDEAKVELRRAYQRQKEAVAKHAKAIEKQQASAQKQGVNYKKTRKDSREFSEIADVYDKLDSSNPFAVYVNPFTVYLDGLLHLTTASDGSDLERAQKSFKRVQGMVANKRLLEPEIQAVEKIYKGEPIVPTVFVIVENGLAPMRRQVTLNFPTPHPKVKFVSTSFPILRLQGRPFKYLLVRAANRKYRTSMLSSMDAIIAKEFKQQLPIMVTRIIINGIVRTVGQKQAEDHFGFAGLIGAIIYGAVINRADLRTWLTLPKEFQFTRLPRPTDGKISIQSPDGRTITDVSVPKGRYILVYLKTPTVGAVSVQTIKLR